jgi:hypothetical protein
MNSVVYEMTAVICLKALFQQLLEGTGEKRENIRIIGFLAEN